MTNEELYLFIIQTSDRVETAIKELTAFKEALHEKLDGTWYRMTTSEHAEMRRRLSAENAKAEA